jgi:hypothetical protein
MSTNPVYFSLLVNISCKLIHNNFFLFNFLISVFLYKKKANKKSVLRAVSWVRNSFLDKSKTQPHLGKKSKNEALEDTLNYQMV